MNYVQSKNQVYVPNWGKYKVYIANDLVFYSNKLYICIADHASSSAFDKTKWQEISGGSGSSIIGDSMFTYNETTDAIVPDRKKAQISIQEWTTATKYYADYLVLYDNHIYKCLLDHTSTTFEADANKWQILSAQVVDDWISSRYYQLNAIVIYNGIMYRCNTAHTSTTFSADNTKWDSLGGTSSEGGIEPWATNKSYKKGDIVLYASQIYKCTTDHTSTSFTSDMASWELVSGVQLWKQNTFYAQNQLVYVNSDMYICMVAHTSSNDFLFDLETNYWQAVVKFDIELIPTNYLQVTKIDLADNSIVDIKIPKTLTFCVKPPMVLKFNPSADIETITQNEFDSSDKDDFIYNANYVIFDGTMHIKSELGVNTSTPEKLIDGYVSISDTINFAEYKSVSGVKVG